MTIVDKRQQKDRSAKDRRRFIDRVKGKVKDQVDNIANRKGLKDVAGSKPNVRVKKKDLKQPSVGYDVRRSRRPLVVSGNREHSRDDKIPKPESGEQGGASDQGDGEDDFMFQLSKEEFMDILFNDMALPDFIKTALTEGKDFIWKKAGVVKEGMPSRLNVRKSMENALARRLANKSGKKVPYLDDIDLRYDHKVREPVPVKHAVMFCLMDVSGSMGEHHKDLAKRFFLLLYLFLTKSYESVDLRFIRYTHEAEEVDEHTFFYGQKHGGTCAVEGLELVDQIMNEEYNLDLTNMYVAMATDGDDFSPEGVEEMLVEKILPKVQYYAYVEIRHPDQPKWGATLADTMEKFILDTWQNAKACVIMARDEVYPALRELFEEGRKT